MVNPVCIPEKSISWCGSGQLVGNLIGRCLSVCTSWKYFRAICSDHQCSCPKASELVFLVKLSRNSEDEPRKIQFLSALHVINLILSIICFAQCWKYMFSDHLCFYGFCEFQRFSKSLYLPPPISNPTFWKEFDKSHLLALYFFTNVTFS